MTEATLQFSCPKTLKPIHTGIPVTSTGLADNWDKTLRLKCEHCGEVHVGVVRDIYTAYALSADRFHGRQT